jgi:riboflavin kinase/FMN adenylyltransferase
VYGDGRGKTLGYPTANIEPVSPRKILPGRGVYLVDVFLRDKHWYGMMNVGVRPTVASGGETSLEVHLFGSTDDVYDEHVVVTFLRKLRDEQKFTSLGDLTNQLHKDKEASLRFIAELDKRQ